MPTYDINLRDCWRIIRKRRTVVILATALFLILSYFFALFRAPDPLYEATSAVKVEQAKDLTTLLFETVSWTSWDNVATQAVIITSFPTMARVATQMELLPSNLSPVEVRSTDKYLRVVTSLKSQVRAEQEGDTNIINITASSASPREATLIANTVAEVFRQASVEERNKKVRETRKFIENQLELVGKRLHEAEENLRTFEEATNLVAFDAQTNATLSHLTSLEGEVERLQQQRLEILSQLALLRQLAQGTPVSKKGLYVSDPPPELVKLLEQYGDLSLRREVLLNDYTPEHPEVEAMDAKLRKVLSAIERQFISMLVSLDNRLQELETRLKKVKVLTKTIPQKALNLARLRREVDVNTELYSQLKSKYQEALIQESGLIEEVTIIKPALEPHHPVNEPNIFINTVSGGTIGLVLGLVLTLILETLDTSLGTIEDVERILGIPVLGVIPSVEEFPKRGKDPTGTKQRIEPLVTHFAPRSQIAEAYRSLRTNLQFIRRDKQAKTFLITSSSLQEGKTYNVVNLSLSLAQAGEKVLLIDADLRRPGVHNIFGLPRQPGVTDYIMGICELKYPGEDVVDWELSTLPELEHLEGSWQNITNTITDVMLGELEVENILKTPGLDNLHIISAGQSFLNPAEIIRSPRFKQFLSEVREFYDSIVVDTPPVLPVADAFEVASEVDGVILVYEVGRIGRGILNRAKVQLENTQAKVLGVILNNIKPEVAPDFYRYRTDYYYKDEDRDKESHAPPRWRKFVSQPLSTFRNIIGRLGFIPVAIGKRTIFTLFLLLGILIVSGFAWQNYAKIRSTFQGRPDQKEFSARDREQKEANFPASRTQKAGWDSSDLSPAGEFLKKASIETITHGQILEDAEMQPDQPIVSPPQSPEEFEPTGQPTEERLTVQKRGVVPALVGEDRAIAEKESAKPQGLSAEPSIKSFVEKWRRAWEEGDLPAYIGCYHPYFRTGGMNIQAWKDSKQKLLHHTSEKDVQIHDIKIKLDGSVASVTFKQSYQEGNHKDYGSTTLLLVNYQGDWSILEESYAHLPAAAAPGEVESEGRDGASHDSEPAQPQKTVARPDHSIQAGAFKNLDNAVRLMKSLERNRLDAYCVQETGLYKVHFGDFSTKKAAREKAETLCAAGIIDAYYLVSPKEYEVTQGR